MSRDITEVIERMLEIIPANETELRADLAQVDHAACYLAPEVMGKAWAQGAQALLRRFGETAPVEGWGCEVVAIWRGKK